MTIEARAFVNYRDYHATTIMDGWDQNVEIKPAANGIYLQLKQDAVPFYLLSDNAEIVPQFDWYEDYFLSIEDYRGQSDVLDDHIYAATIRKTLQPGDSFVIAASTNPAPELDAGKAYAVRQSYETALLEQAAAANADPVVQQLVLAADQFIVKRPTQKDANGRSIIAGYHWFSDWGRDTMIALPGLTLNTHRPDVAASILRTYAQFVDQGMIPNRFPDAGKTPEYNTVDATLWYFEAVRAYYEATGDKRLLTDLVPVLENIIKWHTRGTRYNIAMDRTDGLISAGQAGIQLTWMDAKVGNWVVTDRIGKPVEINALWYNALRSLAAFFRELGRDGSAYDTLADKTQKGFARYWNASMGYCYDILDGPDGHDGKLRPNQLLAISLHHSPLNAEQQRSVVDACARHLLTAHGLRSLSPDDADYTGHYGGDQLKRDAAYHQGTVWSWLIGPFVSAHLRVYRDPALARTFLEPLRRHMAGAGVGSVSEIFDGDPPFTPRGCIAQAWSVAELLRTWQLTGQEKSVT
jgi:predicted glycogen debranching enzyme